MQKRGMHKFSFYLRPRSVFFVHCEIFGEFLNIHLSFFARLLVNVNNAPLSSDKEEEIFASFSVEDVAELQQRRQRRLEQDLLEDVDREIEEFMDLGAHKRGTDSDVELFGSEDKGKEEEESDDSADETEDVRFDGRTYWEKLTSKSSLLVTVQLKISVTMQCRKIFESVHGR